MTTARKTRITVLGDGGWGTGLAMVSERIGHDVMLWSAFSEYVEILRTTRENPKYLPGIKLPERLQFTSDIQQAIEFGDYIVLVIPSQFLRNVLFKMRDYDLSHKILVSATKGIEKKTLMRPSQIISSVLGDAKLAVLSGPSHTEEVVRNIPTLVVAASTDKHVAEKVQQTFRDRHFRIYVQSDVVGVELAAAVKNVIAIAAGICDGMGFGSNTKSALLARGLLEMMHLGVQMGANPNTFFGLAGFGDLVTTCISEFGRNLRVGQQLGKGEKIEDILRGMDMVAEGVETARSTMELAKRYRVEVPIIHEVYNVLFEGKDARQAVQDLLSREPKEELRPYPLDKR